MRKLLLILLLSLPALALPAPEEVVSKLYRTHLKTKDMRKTVAEAPRCFTPEFLALLQKALPNSAVDTDIFTHSQTPMSDFEIEETFRQPVQAQVHLQIWTGARIGLQTGQPQKAVLYLVDLELGSGYQIKDIQFLSTPRFKVFDYLTSLVGG